MTQPVIYMIAGPNGAGKTTAALQLLPNFLSVYEFVNADEIGRGLNPLNPEGQAITSGKLMLNRIDYLIANGDSFAFETTGSSHSFVERLKQAKNKGYKTGLIYLWLPTPELAKIRVQNRVKNGGHNIPIPVIERRYRRGLKNILELYLPIIDMWVFIDSTAPDLGPGKMIANQCIGKELEIAQPKIWNSIQDITEGDDSG